MRSGMLVLVVMLFRWYCCCLAWSFSGGSLVNYWTSMAMALNMRYVQYSLKPWVHNTRRTGRMWPQKKPGCIRLDPTKNVSILAHNLFPVPFLHKHGYECKNFSKTSSASGGLHLSYLLTRGFAPGPQRVSCAPGPLLWSPQLRLKKYFWHYPLNKLCTPDSSK